MHERRFHGQIERLRSPERVALMEVDRVVNLSLEGIQADTALDVGTGSGIFAEAFAALGRKTVGADAEAGLVAAASRLVPRAAFVQAAAEALPFRAGSFDLVFLGHVLHETDDPLQALREALRVARERVAVLEWPYQDGRSGPPLEERIQPERVIELAHAAGFARIERVRLDHMEYFLLDL
jgi:ubiquinone/menaquinone biosynthesis C-methylase UbiE